jgi:hypothetical protein
MRLNIKDLTANYDSPEVVSTLAEMMTSGEGLRIAEMNIAAGVDEDFEEFDAAHTSHQGGHTFERVLCANSWPRSSLTTVDELKLDCQLMPPVQLVRMCSAVANARTTRRLSIKLSNHHDTGDDWIDSITPWLPWMWKHLAYALFCGRSSITHASLADVYLTEVAAEAVASVINSSDPIRELYGSSASATMKLKEGTRLQMLPMNDADEILDESAHWQLANDVDNVLVLESASTNDQDVARVVVPGYGLCQVARRELIAISGDNTFGDLSCGITSLKLDFETDDDSKDGLGRLLEAVGASLKHLHVSEGWHIGDVMRFCPNLESLIAGEPVDATLFVRACRDGTPRLEKLNCVFNSLYMIIDELASSNSNLAQTLKQLVCRPTHGDLEAIAAMLSVNRTLQFIRMRLLRSRTGADVDDIQCFHDQVVRGTRAPLSVKCRLAFLSIFAASRRENELTTKRPKISPLFSTLSALPMDRNVASIIFAFAADNVRRQISIDMR